MASITRSAGPVRRQTDTERRLLDAAQRLLETGVLFTELGVQRIADEAGVARSSFYAHFPDKTQLLLALAQRLSVVAHDAHQEWSPGHEGALTDLLDGFDAIVAHYRNNARILAAVLEVGGYDRDVSLFWDAQLAIFRQRVCNWLEEERAEGRCSPDLDATMAARIVVDGGMRIIAEQVISGDPANDARVARELSLMWWHGAYRRP